MAIPVITVAQMRAWEKATWASGQTEAEVIRRVGKRVARRARRLTSSDDSILILAGKGHETYQEFADRTIDFDDVAVAKAAIEAHPVEHET